MTNTPGPTWYDVLGVSRDADTEEIKAAWRSATDRFEPGSGSGQFRMFNEAAEVLLDPARRAAYDESLAAPDESAAAPEDVQPEPVDARTAAHRPRHRRARQPRRRNRPRSAGPGLRARRPRGGPSSLPRCSRC